MIFGHIDMGESTPYIRDVSFRTEPEKRVRVTLKRYFNDIGNVRVYKTGTFLAENIKPGKYKFQGFHTERSDYYMGEGNEYIFTVKPGQLYYLGSFKYSSVKSSRLKLFFLGEGKFALEQVLKPNESDLLQEMLQYTKGTTWEKKILTRKNKLAKK